MKNTPILWGKRGKRVDWRTPLFWFFAAFCVLVIFDSARDVFRVFADAVEPKTTLWESIKIWIEFLEFSTDTLARAVFLLVFGLFCFVFLGQFLNRVSRDGIGVVWGIIHRWRNSFISSFNDARRNWRETLQILATVIGVLVVYTISRIYGEGAATLGFFAGLLIAVGIGFLFQKLKSFVRRK